MQHMTAAEVRDLFAYNEWANARVLSAAEKLPAEELLRDVQISHKSILGTLLHVAGADWIWLERWHGRSPARDEAWSQWTEDSCADLATLQDRWNNLIDRRTKYVADLDDSRLLSELNFKLLSGDASSMLLVHQMQHVVNHATLHRGQVVGMIRQLGIDPPSTDLIFFIRREISPK